MQVTRSDNSARETHVDCGPRDIGSATGPQGSHRKEHRRAAFRVDLASFFAGSAQFSLHILARDKAELI